MVNLNEGNKVAEKATCDISMNDRYGVEERLLINHCVQAEALIRRVAEINGSLYSVKKDRHGKSVVGYESITAKHLKKMLEAGCPDECWNKTVVNMNPYVKIYHEAASIYGLHICTKNTVSNEVECLNRSVQVIRDSFKSEEFILARKRQELARKKRLKGSFDYIEGIRKKYARVNYIRFDLGYREGKFVDSDYYSEDIELVKSHWDTMRSDLRRGVPIEGLIGFIITLEYGLLAGYHYHILLIVDGSQHQQDITLAMLAGEHWKNYVVPDGEGRYYNCNRYKENYRHVGIGVINHYEEDKYRALKYKVIDYMVKTDFVLEHVAPKERTYSRGKHPVQDAIKRGRPRENDLLYKGIQHHCEL
ncbi:inovirus-type Gp2 protein [Vreelandella janggokensis]|uniref:inovirus-type Gp2 protein n=1 Tax=Vreelandella janggokensis TaxID=370767 RepID=UPI00285665B5|nr:inovirus-type Gp2 protein [Halomonas janggokensis]MDR5885005.1 inovirus-type Gp2 protein [Halomonas janggokensis]